MRSVIPLTLLVCTAFGAFAFGGCTKAGSKGDERKAELVYLRTVLPPSLLEFAHLEVASTASITVHEKGKAKYLGLRVYPGQNKVHGGMRAEVSVDYPFRQGETIRYSWRLMLPKNFVSDAPQNRWWIIGQWHDQPNPKRGETWDNYPSLSPPVLLGLGERNGKLALALSYGPTNKKLKSRVRGPITLERGKWHLVTVAIRWSQGADGKISVFLDNRSKPVLTAQGPNMNNDYQHFWKVGMYRHPEIATNNWIYLDDLNASKQPNISKQPALSTPSR